MKTAVVTKPSWQTQEKAGDVRIADTLRIKGDLKKEGRLPPPFLISQGGQAMGITSVEAFYRGFKPAYFATAKEQKFISVIYPSIIKEYPYVTREVQLIKDTDCYLFFQNEQQKLKFIHQVSGLTPTDPAFHWVLGHTLGYSPTAVEFYVKKIQANAEEHNWLNQLSVSLTHCGQTFSTHIDSMVDDAIWLWNTYPWKEPLQVAYVYDGVWTNKTTPFNDKVKLRELAKEIRTSLTSSVVT